MNHTTGVIKDSISANELSRNLTFCPKYTKWADNFLDQFSYWEDGVALCCVAILGVLMNGTAIFALSFKRSMRNTFNFLLISLFVFDSIFLLTLLLQSFKRHFSLATKTHIILFPYLRDFHGPIS